MNKPMFGIHLMYSGDDRGFTVNTSTEIETKVATAVSLDLKTLQSKVLINTQIGSTSRFDSKTGKKLKTAPTVIPELSLYDPQRKGTKTTLGARIEGKAPLAPVGMLDWAAGAIDQPIVWIGFTTIDNHISEGYININYKLIGKGFPAFEAFIEDENGTKLFIGFWQSPSKKKIIQCLSNTEIQISTDFQVKVYTDKDGNFLSVAGKDANGNEISVNPAAYNQAIENIPPAADVMANKGLIKR
ncbi:hypothetical protein [Niastella populi]|uniref:Uncharacterized protein n=1 Tax=Niastella populi TaxID=550983 RepID=A0A1V9FZ97_9BACT|nr:hypothetical protein [Niastella populi]OQP63673.1 hypothetical protein A4R26_17025 [Niastella populi]